MKTADIVSSPVVQNDSILSRTKDGIIFIDNKSRIVKYNRQIIKLLKIKTIPQVDRKLLNYIDDISIKEPLKKIISSKLKKNSVYVGLKEQQNFLHLRAFMLYDSSDRPIGKLIFITRESTNKKFKKLREDFVTNVSHELKTPLTVIKGSVETLINGALENHNEASYFINAIAKHTERLENLINDILNLSSIEQTIKKENISFSDCKISDIVNSAIFLHETKIKEKNINFDVIYDEDFMLPVNIKLFELAISNLIDNAIKYNVQDGKITLNANKTKDKIFISIEDTGIGISPKHIPRLFERFYRVDKEKSRNIGGTGLGLSIVKQVIKVHGGTINVKSNIDEGTTFTIVIPV